MNKEKDPAAETKDAGTPPADNGTEAKQTLEGGAPEAGPAKLADEVAKLKHELLLARADFENARRRLEKQKQDDMKYAALPLVRELLVVMDNLELALSHAAQDDPMRQGVSMVLDGMAKTLAKFHVERIKAKGEKFNPSLHEAYSVAGDLTQPDDTVVEDARAGYLLHDRLVRPAGVIVNRHPHPVAEAPTDTPTPPE